VLDGVLVPYNVYIIETTISKKGAAIWKGEYVDKREKLSRKKRWEQVDEDINYTARQLDNDVVNPSQIRTIIRAFRDHWQEMFPQRKELPKTLIFAKSDSHADDIIKITREEFGEGNEFCKKVTYKADDPKGTLAQFRNNYYPRIAVTVDMIATGTDVKPLEIVFFMRDIKSRNYFEQMKGRGTRTVSLDDLKKVTPSATYTKDHFVIVDAIGVSKSVKTDSRPLERKPSVPLKDLLQAVAVGAKDEDTFTTLANRLLRLNKQMNEKEHQQLQERSGGVPLRQIASNLLQAYNPDVMEEIRVKVEETHVGDSSVAVKKAFEEQHGKVLESAASIFNGELNEFIDNVRKVHEQIIDAVNLDEVTGIGWDKDQKNNAEIIINDFKAWLETHKDEITALQIFYNQPYRRRELTYQMIRDLLDRLKLDKPLLAPQRIWDAYEQVEGNKGGIKNELVALVTMVRHICGWDSNLTPYDKTVDKNFQDWVFKKQAGPIKFTEEQMTWLRMIKDYIANSFHIEKDDFDLSPFNAQGGLGKMWQLFGDKTDEIINELNEVLVA
ncbi:MAG: restriction endonuclease subunit R, partial [Bacteroidetes bacterium]|nr:restriction endonuclease subunit R [Bacteroidota bacterium]